MPLPKHHLRYVLLLGASLPFTLSSGQVEPGAPVPAPESSAQSATDDESALNSYRQSIQRVDPMDTAGLDYGLANVLRNYYRHNFSGLDNWEKVESIRFDGTLHLPQGVVRFTAFKKKPDLCKVVLHAPNGGRIVMAYDGQDAWQQQSSRVGSAARPDNTAHHSSSLESPATPSAPRKEKSAINSMPPQEAANFIRDATTGGHLLYPLAHGKRIELVGVATVDGERCYDLKITLPDGQVIRSMLDMTDYAERRQITINHITGDEEVNTHSDFREIDGVRVPFASTLTIDGEQIHQSRLQEVETNKGAMPWMFTRPLGYSLEPGRDESAAQLPERSLGADLAPPSWSKSVPFDPSSSASKFQINPDLLTPIDVNALLHETAPGHTD